MDVSLLRTTNCLAEQIKRVSEEEQKKGSEDSDCEESLFCRSLIPRMKRQPSRSQAYIGLKIEQMLFQAVFSERPLHDAVMPGPHFDSMVGYSGYQYSQQLHPVPIDYVSGEQII